VPVNIALDAELGDPPRPRPSLLGPPTSCGSTPRFSGSPACRWDRDRQLWRRQRPGSVAVFQAQIGRVPAVQERDRLEAIGEKVASGEHRQCARRPLRRADIDRMGAASGDR
jgi:hypothetical protein